MESVEFLLAHNIAYVEALASSLAKQGAENNALRVSGGSASGTSAPMVLPSGARLSEHATRVVSVNQQDVFGRTALHVCSSSLFVSRLLQYARDINSLLDTSMPRASPELKCLVCPSLDLTNAKGQTPILCAVRRCDSSSISLLLDAGADPNIQDDYLLACLQMTCARVDPNASQNSANFSSSSPNPASTPEKSPGSSKLSRLDSHHTPSQSSNNNNAIIVDTPEFTKHLSKQAKLLIQHGADISLMDLHHENVLHYACRRADMELLQTLLHQGRLKSGHKVLVALRAIYKDGRLPSSISSRLECSDLLNSALLLQIHREVEEKGLSKLSTQEVCEWLVSIGLSGSRDLFNKNQVTGAFLMQIGEETIRKDFGLESLAQRSTFINRLEELKDLDLRRMEKRRNAIGLNSVNNGFSGNNFNTLEDNLTEASENLSKATSSSSGVEAMVSSMSISSKKGVGEENNAARNNRDVEEALMGLTNARDFEIQMEDLSIGVEIGRGNFGEVRRGQWKSVLVALKTIYRTGGEEAKSAVFREMGILAQLRHPNILGFLGWVRNGDSVMMVTDLMTGGSLHHMIKTSFETVVRLRYKLVSGIVRGMVYLHHRKLVHRDLNSKNILLDDHYGVKISDFGLSRPKNDHKMTMSVGFLGGMAPEVYMGSDYTEKADVFSFAMLVYEIITGKESHHDQANLMMYAHNMATHDYRPPLDPLTIPADWISLITSCWASDPLLRPSFDSLLDSLNAMELAHAKKPIPISVSESGSYLT